MSEIQFSGDDGDIAGDVLGIGYPETAIRLAEAAEELSALEAERPPRWRAQPLAALAVSLLLALLVGITTSSKSSRTASK
jgi:hypothetical protein